MPENIEEIDRFAQRSRHEHPKFFNQMRFRRKGRQCHKNGGAD